MAYQIKGLSNVVRNLNREIRAIEGRTDAGLLAAAQYVEGESNEIAPQKTGTLIGSSFARMAGKLRSVVGYTALYAAAVHEMPDTYNFTKPGTGPKFLERTVRSKARTIVNIIARRARVK